eukprot:GFYU01006113.1.p1 GENE.GFYU01006113.1~~GFYU01006113.1.p1  ORF type:complete len:553 (-),score=195.97 GFYU01006113.1:142-1698(-)
MANPKADMIVILDFGSQYTHLIARRIREQHVYCELHACNVDPSVVKDLNPKGIILSGGPYSVYENGSPHLSQEIWEMDVPFLGICYGLQEMTTHFGGKVAAGEHREYGHAELTINEAGRRSHLFDGLDEKVQVWMSHGDKVTGMPEGFVNIAESPNSEHCAIAHETKHMYAIQFHPEVSHTPQGSKMLENFVKNVCNVESTWSMTSYADEAVAAIQKQVGPTAKIVGLLSGGVDSTVAAALVHRAVGDRFKGYFIDNGLLRLNEAQQVIERLQGLGLNVELVDASEQFLSQLKGVSDPEKKRKIIGNVFIHVVEEVSQNFGEPEYLLQGTLYPDVIESISFKGPSATIKSHHNVGGLLDVMKLKLVEPLRELFKDEVRELGHVVGLADHLIYRQPFPGPGLGIRVLGEIERDALDILRLADSIYIDEIRKAGLYNKIGQAFAVLLPCKSVGVMGDQRTYEKVVALRAVETKDYMTATWFHMPYDVLGKAANRIINEVKGVNRVVFDITSKPPGTIEWE